MGNTRTNRVSKRRRTTSTVITKRDPIKKRRKVTTTTTTTNTKTTKATSDNNNKSNDPEEIPSTSLAAKWTANRLWLQTAWEDISTRYGREFEFGDEVDIMTGEIVVDRGHLKRCQKLPFGRGLDLLKLKKNPVFTTKPVNSEGTEVDSLYLGNQPKFFTDLIPTSQLPPFEPQETYPLNPTETSFVDNLNSEDTDILSHWGTSNEPSQNYQKETELETISEDLSYLSMNSVYSGWGSEPDSPPTITTKPLEPTSPTLNLPTPSHPNPLPTPPSQLISTYTLNNQTQLIPTNLTTEHSPTKPPVDLPSNSIEETIPSPLYRGSPAFSDISLGSLSDIDFSVHYNEPMSPTLPPPPHSPTLLLLPPPDQELSYNSNPWDLDHVFHDHQVAPTPHFNPYEVDPDEFDTDTSHLSTSLCNLSLEPTAHQLSPPPPPTNILTELLDSPPSHSTPHSTHLPSDLSSLLTLTEDPILPPPLATYSTENLSPPPLTPEDSLPATTTSSPVTDDLTPSLHIYPLPHSSSTPRRPARSYPRNSPPTPPPSSSSQPLDLFQLFCPTEYAHYHH